MEHFFRKRSARNKFREDRYALGERLGRGGMGEVYEAEDRQCGRRVAVKLIQKGDSPRELRRLLREFESLSKLDHPGIVKVYEWGEAEDYAYFTMDYIEGKTVDEFFADTPRRFLSSAFVTVIEKIADALAYLHARGILHRDLKPQNIMVRENGDPVLLDFGLAKRFQAAQSALTRQGDFLGTFVYSSPEQLMGEEPAAAGDIYSLGLIIYELLTGNVPLWAENPLATLHMRTTRNPVPPGRYDPEIPDELSSIVMKMLRHLPAQRHSSCGDLLSDLKGYGRLLASGALHRRLEEGPIPDVLTMGRIEKMLAAMPFFESLSPEDRYKIAAYTEEHSFGSGEEIFRQGDPGSAMYVVLEGGVEIRFEHSKEKSERIVTLSPGEIFGEISVFNDTPRTAGAWSIDGCRLLVITKEDMDWLLLKNPSIALNMIRLLSRRLTEETRQHRLKKQ
jgi:serine/threonine protein kinase